MSKIETYFVFKDNLYLQRSRDGFGHRKNFEFSESIEDIQLLSEHEACELANKLNAAVGSTIVRVKL